MAPAAAVARKIAPRLVDLFQQVPIPQVDFERTLGFDIHVGPFVMPRDTLRKRGRAMLGAMEQDSAVWQSDLPHRGASSKNQLRKERKKKTEKTGTLRCHPINSVEKREERNYR